MASSDIIKIGFDYRSSLAQFEKDTNGVFDGISSKAGKQKITIQLDAKDDKVIDKIKELQKLKLDKFTFEFGNSGLKEQLQTFDKLESKINEIINLSKGIGNSSAPIVDVNKSSKEIDKLESKISELNKKYDELQKKSASGSISGKEVNLVDNDEFKKLSQEVSELKNQFDDLKTHMSLLDDYTVPTDRFFELQTQVEATSVKVSDLVDEMTRLSNVQKNLGAETNISSENSSVASANANTEIKANSEIIASIEKKKQALASYELQLEETRYEIEKLSKTENDASIIGTNYSEKQVSLLRDNITKRVLGKYDPTSGKDGSKKWMALDNLTNIDENTLKSYQMWQEELQKVGYTLGEIKETSVGLEADIIPIDGKAITNAEEFRKALDSISTAPSESVKLLNQQVSELESKISSLKSEISSLESTSNKPLKDAFPKTDSSATNASTSAIKEENNALEQTTQSAEKAANSKKKFANANKEVKDSANASVGAIKDENNAFDKNEWDKNVKAIQKYMDTVTELNHLKAKDKGTGKNTSVIADQEQEVERLKNIAYEAKKTLSSIANSNKADVNTWEKWVNVMKQFDQASQGSTRSIARLEDAMRNANNSQIEYMNSVIKRFQNSYDKYSTDASRNGYNPSVEFSDKLSSFNSSLNDLKNLSSSISNGEFVKQEQIDSFKRLTQNAEEAQKSLKNMSASEKGMKSVSVQKEIDKINQLLRENTRYSKEAKIELRSLITQLMSGDPTVNLEAIHTKVMEIKNAEELAGRAGKNFFDILASKSYYGFIGQMQSYLSMYVGFYGMMNSFRNISSAVVQLNSDITELSKVSEATYEQIYNDFSSYADIAKDIGGTISDTISATADWSRNGYNIPDSKELARVALLYKNVGDGIDIDAANESLISTLRGFKMEADEAEKIIDIFNNVSNNEPIDSGGIGEALQRSAASFNAANTSLQESVALISTTNSVIQNPEKVGNMWKVVSMRIRSATSELEQAGEDTDGLVTSTADLQKMIKAMTGYDILESDGETFKSIYDIVLNISKVWNNLSDLDQSSLLQALAGLTDKFARIYRNINYRIYLIARVA